MKESKLSREEILNNAKERLMKMNFEYEFYKMLFNKTNTIQYKLRADRLEADIIELSIEINLF